ncbi:hypothetical protein GALMADRAFT_101963 [Galerina marginata CBS 339.88]|uniref:FAD-binding PCMH-type domain-containing protein n=1 Tax=Galerina marginata (strain CBS 339.88) TaxID=685588 RepID=A0A067SP87_GALM3|nr:hypothetical protein GALMADRAFT_101963 [Galerina marginata CBS 339.88]
MSIDILAAGIQGKIVRRVDELYGSSIYQYAWSTYKETLVDPDAVVYPAGDADVIAAIGYAKSHSIGIAIRTGGHHYTGASSTTGKNLQLDLNDTYTDFIIDPIDSTIVTVGISTTLIKFMDKLKQHGLFVPAGQCSYVNLGGHVQTGGYGHLIRSFGLFSDHVQAVRIITANGQIQWVERGVAADKELFFAILGGSPGNFGVITDLRLKVHRDQDHPKSRGLFGKVLYTPELFKALADIMVAEEKTDEQPADFDYTLTVLSARPVEGKLVPGIVVFVQWANLEGESQDYDPSFFQKIKDAIGAPMIPHEGSALNDVEVPMSTLCSFWVFPIAREFQLPYFKRTYITESRTLEQDGWSSWVTGRLNEYILDPLDQHHISAQYTYLGGKHSRFRIQDPNDDMSFSWRRDSTFVCTMDIFYDPTGSNAKKKAQDWVEKNDAEGVGSKNGKYSKEDRRLLWGSRDTDLPAAHAHYYDSEAKYQALVQTKKKVDPNLVFTANKFAVGDYRSDSFLPQIADNSWVCGCILA